MADYSRQKRYRERKDVKLKTLEAFARWTIERLSGKSGPIATEITDKANEALGGK